MRVQSSAQEMESRACAIWCRDRLVPLFGAREGRVQRERTDRRKRWRRRGGEKGSGQLRRRAGRNKGCDGERKSVRSRKKWRCMDYGWCIVLEGGSLQVLARDKREGTNDVCCFFFFSSCSGSFLPFRSLRCPLAGMKKGEEGWLASNYGAAPEPACLLVFLGPYCPPAR